MAKSISRKTFLAGAMATMAATMIIRPARAARKTVIKFGLDLAPDHPTTLHVIAAGKQIKAATNGEVDVQAFPNNQLGDDTHMLANLRSGAMQMMAIGDNILATLVPSCRHRQHRLRLQGQPERRGRRWTARSATSCAPTSRRPGCMPMRRIWDEGFREITTSTKPINTPEDLHGFKIRVPPSPISLALFQGLGAAPVSLNVAELYTALQTHVVDGQENPLANIETQKFYQVQKYCSLTDHMWVGYWILVNGPFWNGLPADHQKIVADAFDAQALERAGGEPEAGRDRSRRSSSGQGLVFNAPDKAPFQRQLVRSGFYKTWKDKFGARSVVGAGELHRPARLRARCRPASRSVPANSSRRGPQRGTDRSHGGPPWTGRRAGLPRPARHGRRLRHRLPSPPWW